MNQPSPPETIGQLLGRISHLHHKRMHETWELLDLHRGQPFVLHLLWEQDGRTHSELAKIMRRSPATITNMVKSMERAGFVERRADPNDERVSRVCLTKAGRECKAKVEEAWKSFERRTLAGFEQAELDTLQALLERVLGNLQDPYSELPDKQPSG